MTVYHTSMVEQFMELMCFWEMMFVETLGFYVSWIKPRKFSFSILGVVRYYGYIFLLLKCDLMFESTFVQCIVV